MRQAVTFGVPHRELGEDVVAAVVLREGASATDQELREFTAARVAEHKVPRQVLIVEEIPKGPTGKLQRVKLNEQLGHLLHAEFVAPGNEIEETLAAIWADLLKVDRVGVRDNFFLCGGSSLLAAEMLMRAEQAFGARVGLDEFFRRSTLADLAAAIASTTSSGAQPDAGAAPDVVVPVQPNGTRPPFFMAGFGLGWEVRALAAHLGSDQPVYGLRPLAFLAQHGKVSGPAELAAHYVAALLEARPEGPYVLGGGCAGGLVAFEMAQQLTASGREVALVALFDVDYPPNPLLPGLLGIRLLRLPREWAWARTLGRRERWLHFARRALRVVTRRLRWLLPRRRLEDTSPEAQAEALKRSLADLRNRMWRYVPPPYAGRIAILPSADTGIWLGHDRRLAWQRVGRGTCDVHELPGRHDDALREPHVQEAARILRKCIDAAMAARPVGEGG